MSESLIPIAKEWKNGVFEAITRENLPTAHVTSFLRSIDIAEKQLRMRHWRPSRPITFEIAQSARYLARKYRLEQHIPNERPSSLLTVKFQSVFRYETVVFRRHVLSLLLVGLLRKFEAYLVCLTLN